MAYSRSDFTAEFCLPVECASNSTLRMKSPDVGVVGNFGEYVLSSVLSSSFDHALKVLVPERPVGNTDNLYFALDGGSLVHRVVWPKQETFSDVYTTYLSYIKRHYGDEVTVVSDGYTESSVNTKVIERQRRRMKRTSREIIFNERTVLLDPQRQFLSSLANKEFFISQTR
ncbi:hypothetical protein AVEN_101928-1 [Araneus ventricosus]|uniref:Uncharacterized protein n=1 Tax=Araneus ventricosus TaxID=182803 RepID=A0A4Y2DAH4_ARAVE|nr:hypothetical protein AVEN_240611-1 [Araneus ventricosus]GBM13086.1 hypothetical protein AVEN_101928-1 [Araneus ventricosus]